MEGLAETNVGRYDLEEPINQTEYLVDGLLRIWGGPFQEVFSPICELKNGEPSQRLIGSYPLLDEKAALEVLASADKAYQSGAGYWPSLSPELRITAMKKFQAGMASCREEVVKLLMWEIGKSLKDSETEFDRTLEYIDETIKYYKRKSEQYKNPRKGQGIEGFVSLEPRGIVLCMGPYNYPLNETFTTLVPALIAGNVVIFKPPRLGVLLHRPILKVLQDSFPPGVVNTVYGEGQKVISPLISTGKIDVLAFIGSSRVADILTRLHPKPHRFHKILGLEAKNPAIILGDANLDVAVKECLRGSLSFNGQRCTALKALFVEKSVADKFADLMAKEISSMNLGMPWENPEITPMPEVGRSLYLRELVEDAKNYGAKVLNPHGGEFDLTYFKPALLYPVNEKMRIFKEEQFGPVVPVIPFEDIEYVVRYIVESDFGQQASIFSTNEERIAAICEQIENQVARININTQCQRGPDTMPFTGRKDSAEGVLSVSEAIKEFTVPLVLARKENTG